MPPNSRRAASARSTLLPVRPPYRLDLTVEALRRISTNIVDVMDGPRYYRFVESGQQRGLIEVEQENVRTLRVTTHGANSHARLVECAATVLGVNAELTQWERAAARVRWLRPLVEELRGLHPPRYPTLWETLVHAIVFQQISIYAAGAIMHRMIARFSLPRGRAAIVLYPFPSSERIAAASHAELREAGLSANKATALRAAAAAIEAGVVSTAELEALTSEEAARRLVALRGIGPWSAAVVLLRGLGMLDVFPRNDSGVRASLRILSGEELDVEELLASLGPQRGMLYYYLLLGRRRAA